MNNVLIGLWNCRDVLHPNRPNVSKDDLRGKLAELYKANKDQVQVFGFRTQYGGGKSTGFALIYDSHEALKKFEPHYRLVRIGAATKIEKASRQQRTFSLSLQFGQEFEGTRALCADQKFDVQESNARTERRSSGVLRRRRVQPRTRRRNERHCICCCRGAGVGMWWPLAVVVSTHPVLCNRDLRFSRKRAFLCALCSAAQWPPDFCPCRSSPIKNH
jgi:small subunit ribosomal protein S24e